MPDLYRLAYSSILVAGDRGRRFQMSRSVRQGCPLAPFLFLIVTEVFSAFLNSTSVGIQGLIAPISNKMILDVEFADDTTLYLHAEEGNLYKAQAALETFCVASGAKLIGVNQWVFGFLHGHCHHGDHLSFFVGFKKEFQFVTWDVRLV